jgi:hypothetical protein
LALQASLLLVVEALFDGHSMVLIVISIDLVTSWAALPWFLVPVAHLMFLILRPQYLG